MRYGAKQDPDAMILLKGVADMNTNLYKILECIADKYKSELSSDARNYIEVDIGKQAEAIGYPDLKEKYNHVNAVVPIKDPVKGMKVLIDGRTFLNYAQYDSGIAVPDYVAKDAGRPYKAFIPNDSMILNFA
jgi:hypothetical protein